MSNAEQHAVERSTTQSTFVIERTYDASPQRVFDAWADPATKARWFGPSDKPDYSLEFRVGGREHLTVRGPDGATFHLDAVYQDIVPGRRIIHAYDMHRDDVRISVSLAVIEIEAHGAGARLTLTEHGVYLDGHDTAEQREHGTNEMFDALGEFIKREQASV
ncbi:MAG: SRPBCC family protein [Solirubrobacteraceae bacterium]